MYEIQRHNVVPYGFTNEQINLLVETVKLIAAERIVIEGRIGKGTAPYTQRLSRIASAEAARRCCIALGLKWTPRVDAFSPAAIAVEEVSQ